jgi:hypothetical protein
MEFAEVVTARYGLVPYQPELSVIIDGHPNGMIKRRRTSTKDCYVTELEDDQYITFVHAGKGITAGNIAASLTIDLADGVPLNTYVGRGMQTNLITIELDEGNRNEKLSRPFAAGFKLEDLVIMNGTAKGLFNPIQLGPRLFMTCSLRDMRDGIDWSAFIASQTVPLHKLTQASATKLLKSLLVNNWICLPSLAMVAYNSYEYESDAAKLFWHALFDGLEVAPIMCDLDFLYAFVENHRVFYPEYSLKMI